jgi:hypothetical protein
MGATQHDCLRFKPSHDFLFQTAFSAAEAVKLFTSHRASVLQQSSARAVIAPSAMLRAATARSP